MTRLPRRALLGAAFAAPALIGARAQSGPGITADLVRAAQKEGTLSYYHNSNIETTGRWTEIFTRRFGVTVRNTRLTSYPLYDRWLNETRVGRHIADVLQVNDPILLSDAGRLGFIADYMPGGGAAIPADMKAEGVWYGIYTAPMGIGYNSRLVTPAEERMLHEGGWDILADPRWKGRFATATPAGGGSSYAYCYMFLTALRDRYGPAWFRRVAANKPDIFLSKSPLYERIAAGEYAIMDQAVTGTLSEMYLTGAPVRWAFPAPTPISLTAQSVSRHAPHPNAARLFQEWCTTLDGQAEWLRTTIVTATRPDVPDPRRARRADWYAEPWYREPTELYAGYLKDAAFADPKKPVIAEWNDIFNYMSGRKE